MKRSCHNGGRRMTITHSGSEIKNKADFRKTGSYVKTFIYIVHYAFIVSPFLYAVAIKPYWYNNEKKQAAKRLKQRAKRMKMVLVDFLSHLFNLLKSNLNPTSTQQITSRNTRNMTKVYVLKSNKTILIRHVLRDRNYFNHKELLSDSQRFSYNECPIICVLLLIIRSSMIDLPTAFNYYISTDNLMK